MYDKLKDCNIGDYVRVLFSDYSWDEPSKVISINSILTKVKYKNGKITEFSSDCECEIISF